MRVSAKKHGLQWVGGCDPSVYRGSWSMDVVHDDARAEIGCALMVFEGQGSMHKRIHGYTNKCTSKGRKDNLIKNPHAVGNRSGHFLTDSCTQSILGYGKTSSLCVYILGIIIGIYAPLADRPYFEFCGSFEWTTKRLRCRYFFCFAFMPFIISAHLLSFPPGRNLDPGSHSRFFSHPDGAGN